MLICDYALTGLLSGTSLQAGVTAASAGVITLIFIGLAMRSDRWWPFVAAGALTLCVMVYVLEWLHQGLSRYAAISAQIGLWIVVYLTLLAGVAERWLAGERAVGEASVWRPRRRDLNI